MTWIGGGVFTPMLHRVEDDADTMLLDRRRYWWSTCDDICVVIPPELTIDQIYWPWCPTCYPDRAAIDAAQATWTTSPTTTHQG